jgi:hypothetical protein
MPKMRRYKAALAFAALILALSIVAAAAYFYGVYPYDSVTKRAYQTWAAEVTPAPNRAAPNLVQHYLDTPSFHNIVGLGETAIPFLSNRVALYLSSSNCPPGPSVSAVSNADGLLQRLKAQLALHLPTSGPRDVDVYLAYSIIDIKKWRRDDFTNLVRLPMDYDMVARSVLGRLSNAAPEHVSH